MTPEPDASGGNGSGFHDRVRRAHLARQTEIGRDLSQDEVGREVARYLGLQEAIGQGTVSRWFRGSIPDLRTIGGLALVLNVDPGWLAFGDLSAAPKPWWLRGASGGSGAPETVAGASALADQVRQSEARQEETGRRKPGGA